MSSWGEHAEIGAHFFFPSYCKQNGQQTLIYQQCLSARGDAGCVCPGDSVVAGCFIHVIVYGPPLCLLSPL